MMATLLFLANLQIALSVPKGGSTLYDLSQAPESLAILDSTVFRIKRVGKTNKIRIYGKSLGQSLLKIDYGNGDIAHLDINVIAKKRDSSWTKIKDYLQEETKLRLEKNQEKIYIMGHLKSETQAMRAFHLFRSLPHVSIPLFQVRASLQEKLIKNINERYDEGNLIERKGSLLFCRAGKGTPELLQREITFFFPNCVGKVPHSKNSGMLHYQFHFFSLQKRHERSERLETLGFAKPFQLSTNGLHQSISVKGGDLLTWQSHKLSHYVQDYASPSLKVVLGSTGELKVGEVISSKMSSLALGGIAVRILANNITQKKVNSQIRISMGLGLKASLGQEDPLWERHIIKTSLALPLNKAVLIGKINTLKHTKAKASSPALSSLPFIGGLFETDLESAGRREILVAVEVKQLDGVGVN